MDIQRYNHLFFTFFRIVHNVEIAGLILSKMTQKMRPITWYKNQNKIHKMDTFMIKNTEFIISREY